MYGYNGMYGFFFEKLFTTKNVCAIIISTPTTTYRRHQMTAQEHYDLYKQLDKQAMEHLRKAGEYEFVCDATDEYDEYLRLSKLANKHYGIWMGVMTRKHRAWCRKYGVAPSY